MPQRAMHNLRIFGSKASTALEWPEHDRTGGEG